MAIDGNIYVLFGDGTIKKYFKGVEETFTVSGLPKPYEELGQPTLLSTDSGAAAVYVYDATNKRIVELDTSGVYKRQFALPEEWDVKDMFVSGAAKKLWVLVGNSVYEIAL